jgi:DNA-binding MarR family transcriptional regulator
MTECFCQALRQAARHITEVYDRALEPTGLRTTQFSLLRTLRKGPLAITALADAQALDRTTLNRTLAPLVRGGLISIVAGADDRRRRDVTLTPHGRARIAAAEHRWAHAQMELARSLGRKKSAQLRSLLETLSQNELPV